MIAWLSSWLREIIMAILLATFVDLILPSGMMQKYVRVVLSLLILMTILTPMISLFKLDPGLGSLNQAMDQTDKKQADKSLSAIMQEGERLKLQSEADSKLIVEARVQEMIKQSVEKIVPNGVSKVVVHISNDGQNQPQINVVQVILRTNNSGREQQMASSDAITPVEPVAPVSIHIERVQKQPESQTEATKKVNRRTAAQELTRKKVYEQVAQEWQVSGNRLKVAFDDEQMN